MVPLKAPCVLHLSSLWFRLGPYLPLASTCVMWAQVPLRDAKKIREMPSGSTFRVGGASFQGRRW